MKVFSALKDSLYNTGKYLFERDSLSEVGIAISYSIPVATAIGMGLNSPDAYPHIMASSGVAGYASMKIQEFLGRYEDLSNKVAVGGAFVSFGIVGGVWELFEYAANVQNGGTMRDFTFDAVGAANYVLFNKIASHLHYHRKE